MRPQDHKITDIKKKELMTAVIQAIIGIDITDREGFFIWDGE